ncbi:hypothetical protein ACFL6G_07140 [candidate division KSB1 bacterium]
MLRKKTAVFISMIIILLFAVSVFSQTAPGNSDPFMNLEWRHIGPTIFGGRIPDVEAVETNPNIIYVAGSTGGIFKTVNNGITWKPVFDKAGSTLSIGDMAIAQSDPLIIWVGTGEANGEQNAASLGDGVYRSLDGGETWQNMGLKETRHIHRVAIHPKDPDIVFVAAPGKRWGPNPERGLYRTEDGGKTWEKVIYISENTGVVDIVIEDNGRVMYAATYQRRRHAWGIVSAGPEAAIYRSLDGGDTWDKLGGGLPEGNLDKIGLAIAKSRPNVVYAIIGGQNGGLFRSDDRGTTWTKVNNIGTSYWYGNFYVDPTNENKIWVMGTYMSVSIDGGKTFERDWTARNIHVDHHALWINPNNPDHMLLGNDGGFYISYDGARNWDFINNIPIAQFYVTAVDNRDPYWIYGGLQDNGTWGIPSRNYDRYGILNEDAVVVGGGDGFASAIDPRDHTVVYAESQFGGLTVVDLETRESDNIRPAPKDTAETYRFTWNSPLMISPHNPDVLYFGGNKLFKTTDKGENWEEISPDLTRNEKPSEWTILGMEPSLRAYNTITAIAESPLRKGVIYVGTDDGRIHVTMDEGENWQDLTGKFRLPGEVKYVTKIHTSMHGEGTAYISFSGHFNDDFSPYIFKTTDFGKNWKNITGNMPAEAIVKVIRDHSGDPDLLFAGIHNGLMVSLDGGKNWIRVDSIPPVSVDDIHVKNNDLVLGTYGRGIIIMDDIGFLVNINEKVDNSGVFLFPVRDTEQFYRMNRRMFTGVSDYAGPNPEYGVLITYYLKNEISGSEENSDQGVKIQILDNDGNTIRELEGTGNKGINRIAWDLRKIDESSDTQRRGRRGPRYTDVEPGEYIVKLTAGGMEYQQTVRVVPDKRK